MTGTPDEAGRAAQAFGLGEAASSLQASARAIQSLVEGVSSEDARWRPAADQWSILEVVNHLADEEVEDFRARLELIVSHPAAEFAPIDPQGWVKSRGYDRRELGESLARFLAERERSLAWLAGLDAAALEMSRKHAFAGPMSGRRMLANWVAHDLLHVRQLTRLRYERLTELVSPLGLDYAGKW